MAYVDNLILLKNKVYYQIVFDENWKMKKKNENGKEEKEEEKEEKRKKEK